MFTAREKMAIWPKRQESHLMKSKKFAASYWKMKENLIIAIDFAEKVKKINGVLQIVLFGSVSRGEDSLRSDVDIAVIFDGIGREELAKEINKYKHERVQLTLVQLADLPNETEMTGALSGEGLLFYGRPISIEAKKIELKPRLLITYSLQNLPQTEKVKLNRALYGSVSKSEFKGKKYKTEVRGLANEAGVDKISKGVVLADRNKSTKIINVLKRFNAEVKEK